VKKKEKTWLEKFQEFYSGLNWNEKSALWCALGALRGPDFIFEKNTYSHWWSIKRKLTDISKIIKYFTTARIRHEIFGDDTMGYFSFSKENVPRDNKRVVKKYINHKKVSKHFLAHVEDACRSLNQINPGCVDDVVDILGEEK